MIFKHFFWFIGFLRSMMGFGVYKEHRLYTFIRLFGMAGLSEIGGNSPQGETVAESPPPQGEQATESNNNKIDETLGVDEALAKANIAERQKQYTLAQQERIDDATYAFTQHVSDVNGMPAYDFLKEKTKGTTGEQKYKAIIDAHLTAIAVAEHTKNGGVTTVGFFKKVKDDLDSRPVAVNADRLKRLIDESKANAKLAKETISSATINGNNHANAVSLEVAKMAVSKHKERIDASRQMRR